MKIINKRLNFYNNICNNIRRGQGSVYKFNINFDVEKFYNKLTSDDINFNQLDQKNKTYIEFLYLVNRIKNDKAINKYTLNYFLVNLFFDDAQLLPIIFIDRDQNIIFYNINEKIEIPSVFYKFKELISPLIDCELEVSDYDNDLLCSIIEERMSDVENFFIVENGEFISSLMDKFPDDISKKSFETYVEQRIVANLQCDYKVAYPVKPPRITQKWRDEKLSGQYELPTINGTIFDEQRQWFYKTTFILEQYAISGVCEVEEGDVVIDAGAFVGDTALYFAQKTGKEGKVYAFEPIKQLVQSAEENLKDNKLDTICEVVPFALSNVNKTLWFKNDGSCSTTVDPASAQSDLLEVKAVSLDGFVEEREIERVDFLKADLEGADVDFVRGALKTISRDAPKCGLTVYHNREDFIEIPRLLMSARDDYTYYFRCETEPVIFAIKK